MIRPAFNRSRHGVALVMSLFFISLITILVVGFITSMRTERFSADAHLHGVRAQHLAQTGVDIVAARIAQATQTGSFWITQPGRITRAALSTSGFTAADLKNVDLHSGALQAGDTSDLAVDLNLPNLFASSRNLIIAQNVNLKVRWVYLRQDGTFVVPSGTVPAYDKSNPLVGRFAFWADDEGSKVNLNTAWRRSVTAPRWDPSQLNLLIFSGINSSLADSLKTIRTGKHFFHSLDEVRACDPGFSSLIDSNRFDLSILNRTPEINLFGDARIMLTTKARLAGSQPYLNILKDESVDPGLASNVSGASATDKLAIATSTLTTLLKRTDWPMYPGHSLADKFAPVRPEQIALNIIEYVRSRESELDVVEPIRGDLAASGKVIIATSNANSALMGNARGPRITELGIWIDQNKTKDASGNDGYNCVFVTEVYLPPDYGITQIDLTKYYLIRLYGVGVGAIPFTGMTGPPASPDPSSAITQADLGGGTNPYLMAGQCRVIKRDFRINLNTKVTTRPTDMNLRVALNNANGARIDLCTVAQLPPNIGVEYKVDSSGLAVANINSVEVADPCVNKATSNWIARAVNTFGTPPDKGAASTGWTAQQDTDNSGNLSSSGMHFPPAVSKSGNLNGVMESVAELGFVHTGVECSTNGVPFRTVRLQPQKSLQLPDWALLDLFCVPYKDKASTTTVSYYLRDASLGRGGLINLNSFRQGSLVPFLDASGISLAQRKNGFLAAVTDAYKDDAATSTIDSTQADALQTNLSKYTLSAGNSAGRDYGLGKLFLSRGQLGEIAAVSDTGESTEAVMRGVIDLMDVRSNAFTVYAIGQAIIQTANQSVIVQAEQRTETLLIRNTNGKVQQYFSRNLRP